MNIHADIDVGDQVPAREAFEPLALDKSIYGAKNDVATLEVFGGVLPLVRNSDDVGMRLKSANKALGDGDLQRLACRRSSWRSPRSKGPRPAIDVKK